MPREKLRRDGDIAREHLSDTREVTRWRSITATTAEKFSDRRGLAPVSPAGFEPATNGLKALPSIDEKPIDTGMLHDAAKPVEASTEANAVSFALRDALASWQRGEGRSRLRLALLRVLHELEE